MLGDRIPKEQTNFHSSIPGDKEGTKVVPSSFWGKGQCSSTGCVHSEGPGAPCRGQHLSELTEATPRTQANFWGRHMGIITPTTAAEPTQPNPAHLSSLNPPHKNPTNPTHAQLTQTLVGTPSPFGH